MFQTTNQNMNWNMDWMIDCCKKDTKFFFEHFIRYLDKRSEFHQHFNLRLKPYPLVDSQFDWKSPANAPSTAGPIAPWR